MSQSNAPPTNDRPPRRRRPLRKLLYLLIGLVVLIVALACLAPTFASSAMGLKKITAVINRRIHGSMSIESASFKWFGMQRLDNVTLHDDTGQPVLTFKTLRLGTSLWSVLTGHRDFGRIEMTGLTGRIVADRTGGNNLLKAVAREKTSTGVDQKSGQPIQLPGTFELIISDAAVQLVPPDSPPVELTGLTLRAKAEQLGRPLTASLTADTRQGPLTGHIEQQLTLAGFDEKGVLKTLTLSAVSRVTGLPVAGLDALLGKPGLFTAALGPRLDLQTDTSTTDGRILTSRIVANADNLQTDLTVTLDDPITLASNPALTLDQLLNAVGFSGQTRLTDVPVEPLDRSLNADGLLVESLGEKLTLTVKPTTDDQHRHRLAIHLAAEHLNADLNATIDKAVVTTTGQVDAVATPALVQRFVLPAPAPPAAPRSAPPAPAPHFQCDQSVAVHAALQRLSLPLGRFDPSRLAARATVTLADGSISQQPASPPAAAPVGASPPAAASVGTIAWSGMSATITTDNLARSLVFSLDGLAHHAGRTSPLHAHADLKDLFSPTGKPQFDKLTVNGQARLTDLPTPLLDALAGMNGLLIDALDQHLTLTADVTSRSADDITAAFAIRSPTLTADANFHADSRQLALASPARLTFKPTDRFIRRFLPPQTPLVVAPADPAGPLTATATLEQLTIARPPTGKPFDVNAIQLALAAALDDVKVTGLEPTGPLLVRQVTLSAQGSPAALRWKIQTRAEPAADSLAGAAMGKVKLSAAGRLVRHEKTGIALPEWSMGLDAERMHTSLVGSLDENMNLALAKKAQVHLTLTAALLDRLGLTGPDLPTLTGSTPATVTIDRLSAALAGFSPAHLQLAGLAELPKLALTESSQLGRITLTGLTAAFTVDGPANTLTANARASSRIVKGALDKSGSLTAAAKLNHWLAKNEQPDFNAARGAVKLTVNDLPVALAESLAGRPAAFQPLTGPTVDLKVDAQLPDQPDQPRIANVAVACDKLNGSIDLAISPTLIRLADSTKPARFTVALDDSAVQALRALAAVPQKKTAESTAAGPASPSTAPSFHLLKPTTVTIDVARLAYKRPQPLRPVAKSPPIQTVANQSAAPSTAAFNPADLSVRLRTRAPAIALQFDQPRTTVALSGLDAAIDSTDLSAGLQLLARAALAASPQSDTIHVDVKLAHLTDPQTGQPDYDHLTCTGKLALDQLPTALIDAFYPAKVSAASLFGPTASLSVLPNVVNGAGPITVTLRSPNAVADVAARLDRGTVSLERDLNAKLIVTEQLSRAVINHPLLKQVVRSIDPVQLTMAKSASLTIDGRPQTVAFRLSLRHLDLAGATLPRITINPGKLIVRKAGLIKQLLELPQTVGTLARLKLNQAVQGLREDEMYAWFTPVDVSVVHGVATYSRMDMLLGENYQVATWGTLNLGKRPLTVGPRTIKPGQGRMILGIAERAMRRVYGITAFKNEPQYVDQFVMQGPVDSLGADTGEMKVRLLALISLGAASQIAGQTVGNTGIRILKDIGRIRDQIDAATGKKKQVEKRQFDTPPPPRTPFPWPEEVKPNPPQQQQPANATEDKTAAPKQPAGNPQKKKDDTPPEEKIIRDVLKGLLK